MIEFLAQIDVYREHGPPAFISAAVAIGFKPPPKRTDNDFLDGEDLANFLQAFPGAALVPEQAQ